MSLKLLRDSFYRRIRQSCCSFEQVIQIEGEAAHIGGACCSFCMFTGLMQLSEQRTVAARGLHLFQTAIQPISGGRFF